MRPSGARALTAGRDCRRPTDRHRRGPHPDRSVAGRPDHGVHRQWAEVTAVHPDLGCPPSACLRGRASAVARNRQHSPLHGSTPTDGVSNATINREVAALERALTLGVHGRKLLSRPYIPMLRENNVRQGFFERDQLDAVSRHLPQPARPVALFAYITGWRVSEILGLTWRLVDFGASTVRLEPGTTKNGEGRTFPFTLELRSLLEAQRVRTVAVQAKTDRIISACFPSRRRTDQALPRTMGGGVQGCRRIRRSGRFNGGGRGIRTPKGLAARWISSPLPCQLRLALRAATRPARTIHQTSRCPLSCPIRMCVGDRFSRASELP
jgi:integrase